MAFNLKKVLKALLFSSSQPLSIKEIQETFTRFHEQDVLATGAPGGEAKPNLEAADTAGTVEAPPAMTLPEPPAELPLGRIPGDLIAAILGKLGSRHQGELGQCRSPLLNVFSLNILGILTRLFDIAIFCHGNG